MKAIAIIGSAWGDEGKGAAVDALAAVNPGALVIRHSGGSQAGHTVVTPDNTRHVFSHFGSGTLAGAPTYLSEFFVCNPTMFIKEHKELIDTECSNFDVYVHPKALVTTPIDVAINRAMELMRGRDRHGSVGVGFGETIERSERGYPLTVEDLQNLANPHGAVGRHTYKSKLDKIIHEWLPLRLKELGIDKIAQIDWFQYHADVNMFVMFTTMLPLEEVITKGFGTLIFEGAQGLLLDQKHGMTFPYVTRSNTGIENVIPLLKQLNINELDVIYMMRPYLTRHGAGPLPGEVDELPGIRVVDETNKNGPWQASLRLAPMKLDIIKQAIARDLLHAKDATVWVHPYMGLSCIDQVKPSDIFNALHLPYSVAITGHGPKRNDYHIRMAFRRHLASVA